MRLTVFGATGALGQECTKQAIAAGHDVQVLVRSPEKLEQLGLLDLVKVVAGDGLVKEDVEKAMSGAEAVLFAIGVDGNSPEHLCTTVTRHVLDEMAAAGCTVQRFVWCGGGSTMFEGDPVTFGPKFVNWFARTFLGLRHRDKDAQRDLLLARTSLKWLGVRPLQMIRGRGHTGQYRLGMLPFNGLSKISFADCADAMIGMLTNDEWMHKAPIVQY